MMLHNNYNSDHGYGSNSSSSPWMSQQDLRWPPLQPQQTMERQTHKSSSYSDLLSGRRTRTLEDVMREFHMNGSDAPYEPDDEDGWGQRAKSDADRDHDDHRHDVLVSGMGPHSAYLRQKSWPAPERSPAPPLPRAAHKDFVTSTPVFDEVPAFTPLPMPPRAAAPAPPAAAPALSAEQARVLASLPAPVLDSLLRQLQQEKRSRSIFHECRFCKNNGERESFYRGHVLKDAGGRVACPVLRAFRCQRCGASGDQAHTIKYCPLSTNEERIKSTFMMRSVRMASGRRRAHVPPSVSAPGDYVVFGEPSPAVLCDSSARAEPLHPLWAALELKLNSKISFNNS